jgi:hypothetical protein
MKLSPLLRNSWNSLKKRGLLALTQNSRLGDVLAQTLLIFSKVEGSFPIKANPE